jgi:hypothetical protein
LWKVELLTKTLQLPFTFQVALPVMAARKAELDWSRLSNSGLIIVDLDHEQVSAAMALRAEHPGLSAEDCFSLVVARSSSEAILLAGDAQLRKASLSYGLETRDVLWVVHQLCRLGQVGADMALRSAEQWRTDRSVGLTEPAITSLINKLRK